MVEWGNYSEAYKALHAKLDEVLAKLDNLNDPAVSDKIDITSLTTLVDKIVFTYDADGDVSTVKYYRDSGATLLFTLVFSYDADKNVTAITRS